MEPARKRAQVKFQEIRSSETRPGQSREEDSPQRHWPSRNCRDTVSEIAAVYAQERKSKRTQSPNQIDGSGPRRLVLPSVLLQIEQRLSDHFGDQGIGMAQQE